MTDDLPARVAAAAEALEADGVRPTIARVRERVHASANRVHQALQIWQEERRTQQNRQAALLAEAPVSPPLRAALDAVLAAHAQILAQEIDRERTAARSIHDGLAHDLEAARAAVREAATDAQENAAALAAAADEAEARAEKLAAELSDLIGMQESLRTQLTDAEGRLEATKARAEIAERRANEASDGWRAESVSRALAERRLDEGREALAAAVSRAEAAERRARMVEDDAKKQRRLHRAEGRLSGFAARKIAPVETARRRSP